MYQNKRIMQQLKSKLNKNSKFNNGLRIVDLAK